MCETLGVFVSLTSSIYRQQQQQQQRMCSLQGNITYRWQHHTPSLWDTVSFKDQPQINAGLTHTYYIWCSLK